LHHREAGRESGPARQGLGAPDRVPVADPVRVEVVLRALRPRGRGVDRSEGADRGRWTMNVIFFRHGPAVARGTDGVAEAERPLTPEGKKKTAAAARGLRVLDLGADAIFTSPLPRAAQTAEILAEVLKLPEPKVLDGLSPGGSAKGLLVSLRDLKAE